MCTLSKRKYNLQSKDRKLVLPNCASDIKICEDFSNYFTDKVQQMHTPIDNPRPRSSAPVPTPCTSAYLSYFPIVTNHDVGVLIKNMKPKACVHDPFLLICLKCMCYKFHHQSGPS